MSPLFLLGALLLLAGLTGGFHAAVLRVEPAFGGRAVAATVLGTAFVLLAVVQG